MNLNLQDILKLTSNEEKVYSQLLINPVASTKEVSEMTGLPRTRIYEIMSKLANKQLLEKRESNGYYVIPPGTAIENIQESIRSKTEQRMNALNELGVKLSEVWKEGVANVITPGVEIFSFKDIESDYLRKLKNIKSRVFIAASSNTGGIDWNKSGESLARSYSENLDIRYLYSAAKMASRMVYAFKHFVPFSNLKIKIRTNEELASSYILLDNNLYIFFMGSDTMETKVLSVNSSQLIKTFEWMFQKLWEGGNEDL